MKTTKRKWYRYFFEFLSIFIAVISAFALNSWNENRRDRNAEEKILAEIKSGLHLDLFDMNQNRLGHTFGLTMCRHFRNLLNNKTYPKDSLTFAYIYMFMDASAISNKTGYESLKSKGLEIVENDSIRFQIVELYDYYYQIMYKNEEVSESLQIFKNYFNSVNKIMTKYLVYNENGRLIDFKNIQNMPENERNEILGYLNVMENSRTIRLRDYKIIEEKINKLIASIDKDQGWDMENKVD